MLDENHHEQEDLSWQMHMQTLTMRKRNMEIAQTIDEVLYNYYTVERGIPVPNWKTQKDPQWWIDYLKELDQKSK
jgi:hypothetical protein